MRTARAWVIAAALSTFAPAAFSFVQLKPSTIQAFDRYASLSEQRMERDLHAGHFLYMDDHPDLKAKVHAGEILIEGRTTTDNGRPIPVPDGQIQDWLGMMFIPGANVRQIQAVLQDYDNYKQIYKPEVIESRLLKHEDDNFDIFLRLYKKQILTVVLNCEYHVHYGEVDPQRLYVISQSTRIAEVQDPNADYGHEFPIGRDTGFLWRLNSYWRIEQADGGVYAECEAISLSRDVPFGMAWMISSFLERFPRESMINTLHETRSAVEQRARATSALP